MQKFQKPGKFSGSPASRQGSPEKRYAEDIKQVTKKDSRPMKRRIQFGPRSIETMKFLASNVCGEKLRLWKNKGKNVKIVNLRKTYLQIHVGSLLWKYLVVRYKGKTYDSDREFRVIKVISG